MNEPVGVVVARNLDAMHRARENIIRSESAAKIKTALRHNVRTSGEKVYSSGDKVFYKRDDSIKWHGPGVVIGQQNKEVIVKHGHEICRVHPCRIIHTSAVRYRSDNSEKPNGPEENDDNSSVIAVPRISNEVMEDVINQVHSNDIIESRDHADGLQKEDAISSKATLDSAQPSVEMTPIDLNEVPAVSSVKIKDKLYPKIKQKIRLKKMNQTVWYDGVVDSRAGKAGGKYSACFNVRDLATEEVKCVDFDRDNIEWLVVDEQEIFMTSDELSESVEKAKLKELSCWIENNVYEEVDANDQSVISCRWVITNNTNDDTDSIKARLVARGFEDDDLDRKVDSPTASKESIRIIFALIASNKWIPRIMDVKRAFLQGNPLQRNVYLKPPKEANTDKLWRLNKAVYGLNEASRKWYNRIKSELIAIGMKKSLYDEALFYWKKDGIIEGLMSLHVDDILYGGSEQFEEEVITPLKSVIKIGSHESSEFKYLDMEVCAKGNTISIEKLEYISSIEEVRLAHGRKITDILTTNEQYQFRAVCGQLNWVSTQSRPDICYDVCQLSTKLNEATVDDLLTANKVIKKLKISDISLKYPVLLFPVRLVAYCDASYGNLSNGGSQGGFIIFLQGSNGNMVPICWSCKRLRRVCRSTLSAETLAMIEAIDACFWLQNIVSELVNSVVSTTVIKTDNKSLFESVHSTKATEEKRLRVDIAAIRECTQRNEMIIKWVESNEQLADVLTKQGADSRSLLQVLSEHGLYK